jgi:DNA polymerase-3 subunit beta
MKFSVTKSEILKGLQTVLNVVPQRTTFPILSNVLVEAQKEGLSLSATDLDISMSTLVTASVNQQGAVTVPAKRVNEIARELPEGEIDVQEKEERVTISGGRSQFRLSGIPKSEFPELPTISKKNYMSVDSTLLTRAVEKTAFAASIDEMRPVLSGVLWHIGKSQTRMVATDGHRLALYKLDQRTVVEKDTEVNVPPKALYMMTRVAPEGTSVEVRFEEARVGFYVDSTEITARLVEGEFPDYEQVIPKDNDKIMRIAREELISALKRVSIFSNPNTHLTKLSLRKGKLELFAETAEIGEAKDELACDYEGDNLDIGYNASYLLEILKRLDTEEVIFALSGPLSAGLITPGEQKDGEELLYLLMPIRLLD